MHADEIDLTVYPDECDAFGHLNQASFLSLFERARWEMLARGPGMDVFTRSDAWPAVRKTVIDYHAAAFPGDVLRFQQALTHHGRTSFTMRQTARRVADDTLIATAEFVFVCINRGGKPVPVPSEVGEFMNGRPQATGARRLTVNGVRLAVDVRGEGPAVLLIHGFPLDRTLWQPLTSRMHGFRFIAPDLRGFGLSDAPDLGYSMATYASDLVALLDTMGVDKAAVCGLSMGGYVAFEILRRCPERVRALVLMDTRAEPDGAEQRRRRDALAAKVRERGAVAVAEEMMPLMLAADRSEPATIERARAMMTGAPAAGLIGALGALRDRPDSTQLLPALRGLPTCVMVGEEDRITPPAVARGMADAIGDASFVAIPAAGHLPPLEQPEATARALEEFLRGLK